MWKMWKLAFTFYLFLNFGTLIAIALQLNICRRAGRHPICCEGWRDAIGQPCSVPVCGGNCGERGLCIKPDTCLCSDQIERYSCDADEHDQMQADQAISCPDNCNGHGFCANGRCVCDHGYGGVDCKNALQSACYARLNRGLCDRPLQHQTIEGNITTEVTREICCNSIGVAWGQPCQACKLSYCGHGYRQVNGGCRDIDECSIPGVCQRGQCINLEGSFTCKCPTGYTYDKELLDCNIAADACERNLHLCSPGGQCVSLSNGDYQCVCKWRYEQTANKKSCVPRRTITFDICTLYRSSVCKNGICIPRGSSYECACNEGFELSVDRKSCIHKIDMCAVHRGYLCQNGECISMGREYYCRCNPGYTPSYDRLSCVKVIPLTRHTIPELYMPKPTRRRESHEQLDDMVDARIQHDRADATNYWQPQAAVISRIPPCSRAEIRAKCAGNFCLNLGSGAYRCDCGTDYESVNGGLACIRVKMSRNKIPWQNDAIEQKISAERNSMVTLPYNRRRTGHIYLTEQRAPCSRPDIVAKCAGGFCLNLGGSAYMCECLPAFQAIENGRVCAAV